MYNCMSTNTNTNNPTCAYTRALKHTCSFANYIVYYLFYFESILSFNSFHSFLENLSIKLCLPVTGGELA